MTRRARAAARATSTLALLLASACAHDERPAALFRDRTAGSGVDFVHRRCATGNKLIVEITGAGVSLFDYDGDGDLDLFCCQGAPLPGFDATGVDLRDRLYRNDGGFRFTDVTAETGATDAEYTYAAMAPDVDGDGDQDLYLCNVGRNTLLRNDGGRFTDVTDSAGALACDLWTAAAAFVDLDGDGDLDCYLCNYLLQGLAPRKCGDKRRGPDARSYCNPDEYPPAPDLLLRNDDGRFVDVTKECLHGEALGSGLAVVPCDYDDDGDVDLFVSNDGLPNYLWRNDGALQFTEVAAACGVAVNGAGLSEASMGADFADVDGDGHFDLLVATLAGEGNNCFRNDGRGGFDDWSVQSGLGPPSLLYVGFGCELFDFDDDGDDDALVVNGHVLDDAALWNPLHSFEQPPLLLENDGRGRFTPVAPRRAGPFFLEKRVARGLAVGDLDGDGDLDAVVGVNDGRPALLENLVGQEKSWIAFRLKALGHDTFAMGARVTIELRPPGAPAAATLPVTRIAEVRGSSSFGAWQELPVRFGLERLERVEAVRVRWPSGRTTDFGPMQARRLHVLEEPAR